MLGSSHWLLWRRRVLVRQYYCRPPLFVGSIMPTTAVMSMLCFVAIIGLIVAVVRHFTELRARELHEEVDLWRGRYFAMKEKHLALLSGTGCVDRMRACTLTMEP